MGCLRLANTENFEPVLRVEHSRNRGTESPQLNAALGRWMTTDPIFQPHQSPYNSMDGNPINLNDPLGLSTDNGDGTATVDTQGESAWSVWKQHGGSMTWDRFVELNKVDTKTGKAGGETVVIGTTFTIKDPAAQKTDGTSADSNYGLGPGPWSNESLDKARAKQSGLNEGSLNELDRKHQAYSENSDITDDDLADDDKVNFFFMVSEIGVNKTSAGVSRPQYLIYVFEDNDNLWTQYRTQPYLLWGVDGGYSSSNNLIQLNLSAGMGYGTIENIHPYDDINALFENAKGFSYSAGAYGTTGGHSVQTSEGIQGKVIINMYFWKETVSFGKGKYKKGKLEGSFQGSMFSEAERPPIRQYPSTYDTMRNILMNPSNGGMIIDSSIINRLDLR